MEYLETFQTVVAHPVEYARKWKAAHHGHVLGHLCSYTPEEIISAGGLLSFRLFGDDTDPLLADIHLQSNCCSLVRGVLHGGLAGKLDFLSGTVFPHTCDTIQRLSDIWRLNLNFGLHADVPVPVKFGSESAGSYMIDVLQRFRHDLEKQLKIEITDQNLLESIDTYNRLREAVRRLYQLKREKPYCISGEDLATVVRASMCMDRNEFLGHMPGIIERLGHETRLPELEPRRLVLSGGICPAPGIYRIIEDAGGVIVHDDLCTGARYVAGEIELSGDPIESIAARYLHREICPAKHNGMHQRGEKLVQTAIDCHAHGVIFLLLKFCDPHAFDYPYMQTMLKDAGIPVLLLEVEGARFGGEQLKTRCEAFIETL